MATPLRSKWDRASRAYDCMTGAEEARFGPAKAALFRGMAGRCLMVAAGTGHDFSYFPHDLRIVAVDVSAGMLARARERVGRYRGSLHLVQADVQRLGFQDHWFDTAVTVCTFCSVPDPLQGLRELRRVLRPQGRLFLFEHVRSRIAPIGWMQDLMTPIIRRFGPDMNRDTLTNVQRAGFRVVREENVYLDIVKAVEAVPA